MSDRDEGEQYGYCNTEDSGNVEQEDFDSEEEILIEDEERYIFEKWVRKWVENDGWTNNQILDQLHRYGFTFGLATLKRRLLAYGIRRTTALESSDDWVDEVRQMVLQNSTAENICSYLYDQHNIRMSHRTLRNTLKHHGITWRSDITFDEVLFHVREQLKCDGGQVGYRMMTTTLRQILKEPVSSHLVYEAMKIAKTD